MPSENMPECNAGKIEDHRYTRHDPEVCEHCEDPLTGWEELAEELPTVCDHCALARYERCAHCNRPVLIDALEEHEADCDRRPIRVRCPMKTGRGDGHFPSVGILRDFVVLPAASLIAADGISAATCAKCGTALVEIGDPLLLTEGA